MEIWPNEIAMSLHCCFEKKCEECAYKEYARNLCMKYLLEDAAEYIEDNEKEKG